MAEVTYCKCAKAYPSPQLSYGDKWLFDQCTKCLGICKAPCPRCGTVTDNLPQHIKIGHTLPEQRAKREAKRAAVKK